MADEELESFNNNEWVDAATVQEHFKMTFSECLAKFGFSREPFWLHYPYKRSFLIQTCQDYVL